MGDAPAGLARRLRRGSRACSPMGRSIASGGDPKVSKGERREASIQWIQPPKAVSDPEFRQTTSGTHGSAGRADCLPRGKPFGAPAGAYLCPRRGLARRLRRGKRACSPMGRSIASSGDRRFPKGERKALWCARRRIPPAPAGSDAPTPARIGTGRPKGRSHFSFGGERKVCKRKPAARRLREKGFYCPF